MDIFVNTGTTDSMADDVKIYIGILGLHQRC